MPKKDEKVTKVVEEVTIENAVETTVKETEEEGAFTDINFGCA